jgi:hypothetical protein
MIVKLDRDQLAADLAALNSLLESLPHNDYLGRMGLEFRRDEVREQLERLGNHEERRARVALYLGGEPVVGSMGVQAGFGTKVVGSFQDLMSKVWGASEGGEQLQPMGPIRDKDASQLHITNLVHGSFGFLLEELDEEGEPLFETPLSKAADQATEYIANFADENEANFSKVIEDLNPRVFQSLRDFFGYMHKGKATFRLVEGERDEKFDHAAVERAWYRAEASNIDEERVEMRGRLLGVIPMRRRFELEPDGATTIIEGKVGEKFSHTYLERISTERFAGRRWKALLDRRIVTKVGRLPVENYTLLELEEIGE